MKKTVYIIVNQHFDLSWRRGFRKDIEFKGQNFVSYAKLEAYYIIDNLKYLRKYPEYKFQIESPAVLEEFLITYPEYKEEVTSLIKEGRVIIPFTGMNIVDSNMIQSESIIENYLYGYKYMEKNFGIYSDGCDRNDAFGNSAQLPQIINGFGVKWAYNFRYSVADKPYWKGLDGSILYMPDFSPSASTGGWYKYRPCTECNGYGCDACNGRGIDEAYIENYRDLISDVDIEKSDKTPCYIYSAGEEILPNDHLMEWVKSNEDKYDIIFTGAEAFRQFFEDKLKNFDSIDESEIFGKQELNPNNTGTYVTRIKLKQKIRKAENELRKTEFLCAQKKITDNLDFRSEVESIWQKLLFTMFHDNITSTHVDIVYDELNETLAQISEEITALNNKLQGNGDNCVNIVNPNGCQMTGIAECIVRSTDKPGLVDADGNEALVLSCEKIGEDTFKLKFIVENIGEFGSKTYTVSKDNSKPVTIEEVSQKGEKASGGAVLDNNTELAQENTDTTGVYTIENEFYEITSDISGIVSIKDKLLGKEVCARGEYSPFEWVSEHDEGSPWATIGNDRKRSGLGKYTSLKRIEKTDDCQKLVYEIAPPVLAAFSVFGLKISYEIALCKKIDKVLFEGDAFWDTYNHRIRIAIPTTLSGKHKYEIPGGIIEREEYSERSRNHNWANATDDWPAIGWAGVDGDGCSVAVFNQGTPSYSIKKDENNKNVIFVSVLRSPTLPTYLHDPGAYVMNEWDGMRDVGNHHFSLALKSYAHKLNVETVKDSAEYSDAFICIAGKCEIVMPTIQSQNSTITYVKPSVNGEGIIVRLTEYNGEQDIVNIEIPEQFAGAYETDMKEDILSEITDNTISIHPYGIKTIFFKLK